MTEELMLKLLEEQQKTNELLQTIVSSLEQESIDSDLFVKLQAVKINGMKLNKVSIAG